ncbi:MAG: hypothetical protein ACRBDL_08310 [Alphaproteobacteria bacterium]
MAKDKTTKVIVGDFEGATVAVGNWVGTSVDLNDMTDGMHELKYRGDTYQFVDAKTLSPETIEDLSQNPDTFVFGGDLHNVLIEVTSGGIRAEHIPALES